MFERTERIYQVLYANCHKVHKDGFGFDISAVIRNSRTFSYRMEF